MTSGGFKEWHKRNPWFGKEDTRKTNEFLGIATSIRGKTDLLGESFMEVVETVWKDSNLKDYPQVNKVA